MKEKLTHFQMIRQRLSDFYIEDELFVSNSEINSIREDLCLSTMDPYELRNLRDMVVMVYHNWKRDERLEHDDGYIEYTDRWEKLERTCSGVLSVIDAEIYDKTER